MTSNLNFNFAKEFKIYKFPSYRKRYAVYAYDTKKYRQIWAKLAHLAVKFKNQNFFYEINPYKVLEHCYIRDKNGKKKYLGDAKHIYRYGALERIYELIAEEIFNYQLKLDLGNWRLIQNGLIIHLDGQFGNSAELQGTELLPISQRLKIHIELLRQLRQGMKLKKAVKIARKKVKLCFVKNFAI